MAELLGRLRRAVKKLTFLLNLKRYLTSSTWRIVSMIRRRAPATTITGPNWGRRRAYSFNDRPGLRACVEVMVVDHNHNHNHHYYYHGVSTHDDDVDYDGGEEDNNGGPSEGSGGSSVCTSPYPLRRAMSYPIREENIDNQAEMFIEDFYKHLFLEKQVSMNLRYCRDSSSFTSSSLDESIISPLSSIVSP